jgi:hypothetical protein
MKVVKLMCKKQRRKYYLHFINKETEAQKGIASCIINQSMAEKTEKKTFEM